MSDLRELYQEVILDHGRHPRNFHPMEQSDCHANGFNPLCGDKCTVFLKLEGDRVADVSFQGAGCAISQASASLMTQSVKGKSLDEAKLMFEAFHNLVTGVGITPGQEEMLGKLNVLSGVSEFPARVKCATLAWHTMNAALDNQGDEPVTTE